MNLHDNKALFDQAVRATAQKMDIPDIYIEKDYWVTYALHAIFHHEIGTQTVFKGGTALSKCFGLIERFSEDIDLVVLREDGESGGSLKKKITAISNAVKAVMPEVNVEGLTRKMGMNRKTAHSYSKTFEGNFGQVRDVVVVEATWLGYFEPYVEKGVSTYIYEMMLDAGQNDLIEEHGLSPFEVKVLHPKRSICEKIMSLVRFSYSENPIDDLKSKIRHTYDLHCLLQEQELKGFLDSKDFDQLLLQVANDDVRSYPNNNEWLAYPPQQALLFKNLDDAWKDLETTYSEDFRNLVYGDLPTAEDVRKTLELIKNRITKIDWQVSIESKD